MNKKKILKIVLIVILVIILLFIIHITRNFIIIRNLQKNLEGYVSSSNYYMRVNLEQNGEKTVTDYYRKDNNQKLIMDKDVYGEKRKVQIYDNGERIVSYYDDNTAEINVPTLITFNIYNNLETDNNWQILTGSIGATIRSIEYNGKDCYIINNFEGPVQLVSEKNELYIEKDTGLCLKSVNDDMIVEREYEFDIVDDETFVEPDISQYTIIENE